MGAENSILVLYAVSAVMAFGAAFLPGSGLLGRVLCAGTGVVLIAWPASTYLLDPWYPLSRAVVAVPILIALDAAVTVRRHLVRRTCFPDNLRPVRPTSPPLRDRRGPGRRTLPGEYGHVPVNQVPPRHDPWAALYGSVERELMRGRSGRHRAHPATLAETAQLPAAGAARQAAFAAMQAYAEQQDRLPNDAHQWQPERPYE